MRRTYDFATIGFRPFAETQEFVTIGVVALDTAARHFDFVLQDARKTGRVAAMFPRAGKSLFREAHVTLKKELESIRTAVNGTAEGKDVPVFPAFRENENGLFAAITSPREVVFCYPVKGRCMAAEMDDVLAIAARGPKDESEHRGDAFRQIRAELLAEDFVCVGEEETAKVIEFARIPESPVLKLA
jgi:hypothetical protein